MRAACGKEQLDALDVGCGVSPLLFALADGEAGRAVLCRFRGGAA